MMTKRSYIAPAIALIVSEKTQILAGSGRPPSNPDANAKGWQPVGDDLWDNAWNKQSNNNSEGQSSLPKPVSLWDD
jgi:hypothetical protein